MYWSSERKKKKKAVHLFFLQVGWVPGQKKGELVVLSAGSGGRVLLWSVDAAKGELVLSAGYALVRQQVSQGQSHLRKWM